MTKHEQTYQTDDQFFIESAFIAARGAAAGGDGAEAALHRLVALIVEAVRFGTLPNALVLTSFLRLLELLVEMLASGYDYNWHDDCCGGDCPEMDESLHPDAMLRRDHRFGISTGELARRHCVARAAIRTIVEWRTHCGA